MFKSKNAITLIALIITIVILLILAALTINMVLGENGLINKAKTSVGKYENAQEKENTALSNYEALIDSINSSRDIDTATLKSLIKEVIKEEKIDTTPIGTIIAFSVNSIPSSEYLVCNGQSVSKTEYSELYALLGETYGAGDNNSEFKVPDLRGEFLRGAGTATRNTGSGGTVGEHQNPTEHRRILYNKDGNMEIVLPLDNNYTDVKQQDRLVGYSANPTYFKLTGTNDGWVSTSHYTSRPTNTSVLYCIKAK